MKLLYPMNEGEEAYSHKLFVDLRFQL